MAIWLEVGGGANSINDNSCQRLAALGAKGVHCVAQDMGTYQAQLNSIKKYGMVGTLDIEVPLWVNTGMNVNADLSGYLPALQAQKAAGWSYFAAEGIGRAGVAIIGSVAPYINYGDENGANMYAGQYNHAPNAHFANLLESYHKAAVPAYLQSAAVSKANCSRFGLTLMMYTPSDLEQDTTALLNYINQVGGVQDVLMWTGASSDILSVFNQPWANIVSTLKAALGFRNDTLWATTPVPPPVNNADGLSVGIHSVDPNARKVTFVGQTFLAGKEAPRNAVNFRRSAVHLGTTDYVGTVTSDSGGNFSATMPLAPGENYFWIVLGNGKGGRWTTDVIYI